MEIYVDIDGTIAGNNLPMLFRTYIKTFGLQMELDCHMGYWEFLQLPEIVTYKQRIGEREFKDQRIWAELDPEVLRSLIPLPGAIEGVLKLSNLPKTFIGYCTGRYSGLPKWVSRNQEMVEATKNWLDAYGFPCSSESEMLFCRDKLSILAKHKGKNGCFVVLIDDQYQKLLQRFALFEQNDPIKNWLKEHFMLIAYGVEEFPPSSYGLGLRVFPLPSWKKIEVLFEYLQRVE